MSEALHPAEAAGHMDDIYRYQRFIYDASRKYFLLGRDRLLDRLDPQPGDRVLEVGCGTARNLILAARRYPQAKFHGFDISPVMLKTAGTSIARAQLGERISVAQADATNFTRTAPFHHVRFERVFLSYTLSMIPPWHEAMAEAQAALVPGGSMHIVDFGQQANLPAWFRTGLRSWLTGFSVAPRAELRAVLEDLAAKEGGHLVFESLYRDYAWHAILTKR